MFKNSKYKHLNCQEYKSDKWYPDLRTNNGGPEMTMIASSWTYLAVNWMSSGAGIIGCIPITTTNKRKQDPLFLKGHSGTIIDIISCPFDDNLFFSSSQDCTIKGWKLPYPTQLGQSISPSLNLVGHKKKVDCISHHFSAPLIASSGSDNLIKLWDYNNQSEISSIQMKDMSYSLDWNYMGDTMIAMGKDKKLHVIDFRTNSVVKEYQSHEGNKIASAKFVSKTDPYVFSIGFDRMMNRQNGVYDLRQDKPLSIKAFPGGSSICKPIVDIDTSIIYCCGRGDNIVKIYEFDPNNKMYVSELTQQNAGESLKGISVMPKRSVNVSNCEINSILRLGNNRATRTGAYITRRASTKFQADLYPETLWVGNSMTVEEYQNGENKMPNELNLEEMFYKKMTQEIAYESDEIKEQKRIEKEQKEEEEKQRKIAEEEEKKRQEEESRVVYKGPQIVRSTHFRHTNCRPFNKNQNIIDCKVNVNNQQLLRVNKQWVGIPWTGIGKIAVWPIGKSGKMINPIFCDYGGNIADFFFDPFNDNKLYIGGEDGRIKVYVIEENKATKIKDFQAHQRRITSIVPNTFVENCILSTGAEPCIKMWDIENEEVIVTMEGFGDNINNISMNSTGDRIAVSSKDKKVRIFNLRNGEMTHEIEVAQCGGKGFMTCWAGHNNQIITVGFNRMSQRSYSLINILEDKLEILHTQTLDNESAVITPIYDEDLNICYFIGKGSRTMQCFEITEEKPYIHALNIIRFNETVFGFDHFKKEDCNVKEVEIMHLVLLTGEPPSTICRNTIYVPRVRTNYFQDDIYPPTRKIVPLYTIDEWKSGEEKIADYISLQPFGMEKLSDAPPENERAKYSYAQEQKRIQEEEEFKKNMNLFDRIRETMMQQEDSSDEDKPISEDSWSDD